MHYPLLTAALAAFSVTSALAGVVERDVLSATDKAIQERDIEERAPKDRTCGSIEPPKELLDKAASLANIGFSTLAAHPPIVVNTYFHVVTSTAKQGRYTQAQLNSQVSQPPHLLLPLRHPPSIPNLLSTSRRLTPFHHRSLT